MPDYASMYKRIFNATTDAVNILQQAQQDAEEMYISSPDPEIRLLSRDAQDSEPDEDPADD